MSQGDGRGWNVVGRATESNWELSVPESIKTPEVSALLVLAMLMFAFLATGNRIGLW